MNKSILLVEDNPDDEALTLRAFRKSNIVNPIDVVRDGVEALDFLFGRGMHGGRNGKSLPTLIILDLNLPRLDGLKVLKAIRENAQTRLIPVIVLTSSIQDEDLISSYANGANSYVRKPVDFTAFLAAANLVGLYWLMLNQPPPVQDAR